MAFWTFFWGAVLLIGLLIFAVITIIVAIGGFFDVKSLFESIDRQHQQTIDENG